MFKDSRNFPPFKSFQNPCLFWSQETANLVAVASTQLLYQSYSSTDVDDSLISFPFYHFCSRFSLKINCLLFCQHFCLSIFLLRLTFVIIFLVLWGYPEPPGLYTYVCKCTYSTLFNAGKRKEASEDKFLMKFYWYKPVAEPWGGGVGG